MRSKLSLKLLLRRLGVIKTWKIIFETANLLKATIRPSRVKLEQRGSYIVLFCCCMKNECLKS